MLSLKQVHWNLGLPKLLPEWKSLFSTKYLGADLSAGITVAFVAIPLSLAIALASGVSPGTGIVTAIVAGIVCALFGGTPLSVSGPAAAMSVLIADTVEKFGMEGLLLMCLMAGLMQLLSGIFGLGKLGRYVPLPVVAGFTAGIGMIILIGQLPRAFGLLPPPESHVFGMFSHLKESLHQANMICFFLVILTIVIIRGLPKLLPRVPPILPAVAVTTLIVYIFKLDVPLIGAIPRSLPAPTLPTIPSYPFSDLLMSAFAIYVLASLETLLSSTSVDKLTGEKKHDADQELIGQGLGNIIVPMFGGMPVTGVIARSATNVRAGAKTRRSSVIQSITILLTVFFIAPVISLIPIAALAGVLFSVAFSMLNYKESYDLWVTSRAETFIYALTFFTIVFVDLIVGVQAGVIAAALLVLLKGARTRLQVSTTSRDNIIRLSLSGSLTFLSNHEIDALEKHLEKAGPNQTVMVDLSNISNLDISGANIIVDLFNYCTEKGIQFYILGLPRRFEPLIKICGGEAILEDHYLISENELRKVNHEIAPKSSYGRLIHGVHRFYAEAKTNDRRLFEYIAKNQDPHTLFIACADSRVMPSLITSTDPGELFTIRNVGNFIPPYGNPDMHSEAAALEFALNNLHITDIVVCGHANCGAMAACCKGNYDSLPPQLRDWIKLINSQLLIEKDDKVDDVSRQNVLNQVKNIKRYPIVRQKIMDKTLAIHAWFFDFEQNIVYEWNKREKAFTPVGEPVFMN